MLLSLTSLYDIPKVTQLEREDLELEPGSGYLEDFRCQLHKFKPLLVRNKLKCASLSCVALLQRFLTAQTAVKIIEDIEANGVLQR